MDHLIIDLIDQKACEAEAVDAFGNLEAAGKALPKEDDPVNALLNRLVREAGGLSEFVALSWAAEKDAGRAAGDRGSNTSAGLHEGDADAER